MTRQRFIEDVNSFWELKEFCDEQRLYACDNIYAADYINDILLDRICDMRSWRDVRDFLQNIPTGCEYYEEDDYGDFNDADSLFDDYKQAALEEMDQIGWDEEDEDDDLLEDWDLASEIEETRGETDAVTVEEDAEIEMDSFMAVLGRAS